MSKPLPNLFEREPVETAAWLYIYYLAQLLGEQDWETMISVCQEIRSHANESILRDDLRFTFNHELHALCELQRYADAWEVIGQQEEMLFGHRLDHASHPWQQEDAHTLGFDYSPVLYFLGQYELGCQLLETALKVWNWRDESFDIHYHIDAGTEIPADRWEVTLRHFYTALGKDLREWRQWEQFARGFHPLIYERSGITAEMLLADPNQLRPLEQWCREEMKWRFPDGNNRIGGTEALIEPIETARAADEKIQEQRAAFDRRPKPQRVLLFEQYFPEFS